MNFSSTRKRLLRRVFWLAWLTGLTSGQLFADESRPVEGLEQPIFGGKSAEQQDLNICQDNNYRAIDTVPDFRRSSDSRSLRLGQTGVIWPMSNRSVPVNADCTLQLSTCPTCQIVVTWNAVPQSGAELFAVSADPTGSTVNEERTSACESLWDFRDRQRCVDLRLIETDADQTAMKPYRRISLLNPQPEYRSQVISSANKLDLNLQFWRGSAIQSDTLRQIFPLKYTVIDNSKIIRGRASPTDLPTNYSEGYIFSPRFPKTYPENVLLNYTLINDNPEGSVRLVFTDFRIHYMSNLKIFDSNGQEIANSQAQYGTSVRPPSVQSSGNSLVVIFTANNYKHDVGFRATYKFVSEKSWPEQPSSKSCDRVFEDSGGAITIERLGLDAYSYVDCIWVLEKPRYAPIGFDKLFLKVEDFSVNSNGKGIQLDIHAGRTSVNRRLLTIFGPRSGDQLAREQPQEGFLSDNLRSTVETATTIDEDDSDTGFYLRLRGYLGSSTGLTVTFTQFYRWSTAICHDVNEFHCDNGRCILKRFQCDGYDNCGDFSDEVKCQNKKAGGEPEADSSFSLSNYSTTILLVAGLIGLTLVLLMVTIIVARVYRQKLARRFAQNNAANGRSGESVPANSSFSNVSASFDDQLGARPAPSLHQIGNRRLLMLPESDIGVLEAPPTYDDALKHPTVPVNGAVDRRSGLGLSIGGNGIGTNGQGSTSGLTPTPTPTSASASAAQTANNVSFDNPTFSAETGDLPAAAAAAAAVDLGEIIDHDRRGRRFRRGSSEIDRSRYRSRSSCSMSSSCSSRSSVVADADDTGSERDDRPSSLTNGRSTTSGSLARLPVASDGAGNDVISGQEPTQPTTTPSTTVIRRPQPPEAISSTNLRKPPVPLPRSSKLISYESIADAMTSSQSPPTYQSSSVQNPSVFNRNDTLV